MALEILRLSAGTTEELSRALSGPTEFALLGADDRPSVVCMTPSRYRLLKAASDFSSDPEKLLQDYDSSLRFERGEDVGSRATFRDMVARFVRAVATT